MTTSRDSNSNEISSYILSKIIILKIIKNFNISPIARGGEGVLGAKGRLWKEGGENNQVISFKLKSLTENHYKTHGGRALKYK